MGVMGGEYPLLVEWIVFVIIQLIHILAPGGAWVRGEYGFIPWSIWLSDVLHRKQGQVEFIKGVQNAGKFGLIADIALQDGNRGVRVW